MISREEITLPSGRRVIIRSSALVADAIEKTSGKSNVAEAMRMAIDLGMVDTRCARCKKEDADVRNLIADFESMDKEQLAREAYRLRLFMKIVMAFGFAMAISVMLLALVTGCSNMKDPTCKAIEQGIAAIDAQLEKGADGASVLAIYQQDIKPIIHAKGLDDVLGMAKEYWDSMSTEEKLKAGRAILVFMQEQYCTGTGGCGGTPSKDAVMGTIVGIVRVYAGSTAPGQAMPYEGGGR